MEIACDPRLLKSAAHAGNVLRPRRLKEVHMLELRPNCECCDADLPFDAHAMICSYECTFCEDCASERLQGICPNCGGELVARPVRPAAKLASDPASTVRVTRSVPCL